MKVPVILYKDYTIFTEQYKDKLFLHCDVYKWNKKTRKDLQHSLDLILRLYKQDVYALHENTDDNKHRKFLEMYKFELYSTEMGLDGLLHQVWRKRNKTKEIKNG